MGVGAAVIGGSVVSGMMGSKAAGKASDASSAASAASIADKYELPQITETHNRITVIDGDLTEAQMKTELDTHAWVPVLSQMRASGAKEATALSTLMGAWHHSV